MSNWIFGQRDWTEFLSRRIPGLERDSCPEMSGFAVPRDLGTWTVLQIFLLLSVPGLRVPVPIPEFPVPGSHRYPVTITKLCPKSMVGQETGRDSLAIFSRSRLFRGTTIRDSPTKIFPGLARPADNCPGPGPTGQKKCRNRSGLASCRKVPQVPTYISWITLKQKTEAQPQLFKFVIIDFQPLFREPVI